MLSLPNVINRFKAKDTSEYEPVIRQNPDTDPSNSSTTTSGSNSNVVQRVVDARRNRLWFFLVGITCCVVLIPFYVSSRDSSSSSSSSTSNNISTPPVADTNIGDSLKNSFTTNKDNIPQEEEEEDDDNFNTEIKSCLTSIKNLPITTQPKMSREASECIETLTTQGGTPPSLSSFSFNLFSTIINSSDVPSNSNVLISPLSIASALALVLTGATNHSPCQTQLQNALSITSHLDMAVLHRNLMSSLQKPMHVDHVELNSANGIWIKEEQDQGKTTTTSTILDSYVNLAKQVHDASAAPLPQTYEPINDYIESKTNGMISNMMEGDVDPLTVAILVNAVYFKGLWQQSFNPDKSIDDTFFAKDGISGTERRKAKFMVKEDHMEVAFDVDELNGASIVRLDYGKSSDDEDDGGKGGRHPPYRRRMMKRDEEEQPEFSAFFILPSEDTTDGIDGVFTQLAKLTQPSKTSSTLPINNILSDTAFHKIKLILPRFKLTTPTTSLTPHLQSLGIKDVFNGSDVLNQMSNDPDVHLSDMLHKAVMEVTEEGTVAAAATVGIMMTRAMPMPSPELKFDRPFGVLVVYKNGDSGEYTPLFMGRVNDPEFVF